MAIHIIEDLLTFAMIYAFFAACYFLVKFIIGDPK